MTTTERQPLRYQVAHPSLVCRADLLDAQAFEVEVEYGRWNYEEGEEEWWSYIGKVRVWVAAFDEESAKDAIPDQPLDAVDARYYSALPFKTV